MDRRLKNIARNVWKFYRWVLLAQLVRNIIKFVKPFMLAKYGYILGNVKGDISNFFMQDLKKNWYRLFHAEAEGILKYPDEDFVKQNEGPMVVLVPTSEAALEWVLRDEFRVMARCDEELESIWTIIKHAFGDDGIAFVDHTTGEEARLSWLHRRRVVRKFLSVENLRTNFIDTFSERGKKFVELLTASANKGEYVDMYSMFSRYAVDSAQKIFFGQDALSLENGLTELDQMFNDIFLSIIRVYRHTYFPAATLASIIPYPFGNLFLKTVTMTSRSYKEYISSATRLRKCAASVIADIKEKHKKTPFAKQSLVSVLIEEGDFPDHILLNLVSELMLGGRDTAFGSLSWLMYELGRHPNIQRRLHQEVTDKLRDKDAPSYDDISAESMPYLNAVIYEALRLHPPVTRLPRTAKEDVTFTNAKTSILIPKRTRVRCSVFAMLRNPKRYPDPLSFKPDRWLPWEEPSDFAFPIFAAGARNCVGKKLYLTEAKVVICMLFKKFVFEQKDNRERYTPLAMVSSPSGNKEGTDLAMHMKPSIVD